MNEYGFYPYPEYDGPVANPPMCERPVSDIDVTPKFGPVPCPPHTREQIMPKVREPLSHCKPPVLAPLPPHLPPQHTQVQPRCFTCKHFEMCQYKKDYLKTVRLIQNCLGAPQHDYELTDKYIVIPDFKGFPLMNQDKYFPQRVSFDNEDHHGHLFLSKFNGINYVNVVYMVKHNYILIQLKYDNETEFYELKSCEEAFYGIKYELKKESLEEIQLGLAEWREAIVNAQMPPPPPRKEIINTTHFSSMLNCDMYEWDKSPFEEAVKRLIKKYPYGIPIDEHGHALYHIATYHIEQGEVPYAPFLFGEKGKHVAPYIPPQPVRKPPAPPKRRGDM